MRLRTFLVSALLGLASIASAAPPASSERDRAFVERSKTRAVREWALWNPEAAQRLVELKASAGAWKEHGPHAPGPLATAWSKLATHHSDAVHEKLRPLTAARAEWLNDRLMRKGITLAAEDEPALDRTTEQLLHDLPAIQRAAKQRGIDLERVLPSEATRLVEKAVKTPDGEITLPPGPLLDW